MTPEIQDDSRQPAIPLLASVSGSEASDWRDDPKTHFFSANCDGGNDCWLCGKLLAAHTKGSAASMWGEPPNS